MHLVQPAKYIPPFLLPVSLPKTPSSPLLADSLFSPRFSPLDHENERRKYIYTHTYIFSVVPPRRNLKLMVNYIRPATELGEGGRVSLF